MPKTKIYVVLVDGKLHQKAYTALFNACHDHDVSYNSAIKGRDNNSKGKHNESF